MEKKTFRPEDKPILSLKFQAEPIAWKRAGKQGTKSYDTQKDFKISIAWEAHSQLPEDFKKLTKPLHVVWRFECELPPSWSISKKGDHLFKHKKTTPDLSNYIKFYEDALNGIIWSDDKLIASTEAIKIWGHPPQTLLEVYLI